MAGNLITHPLFIFTAGGAGRCALPDAAPSFTSAADPLAPGLADQAAPAAAYFHLQSPHHVERGPPTGGRTGEQNGKAAGAYLALPSPVHGTGATAAAGLHAYERRVLVDGYRAPADDFRDASSGKNLNAAYANPPFGAFRSRFRGALESLDYGTSDAIIDRDGNNIYGGWKRYAERLEGLNAALFRVARDATRLNRFIASLGELDNYRRGMWREEGDAQDRVPTTAGESNVFLDKWAVARVSYPTVALAGWTQPVRYSPYPRNTDGGRERFGGEKDGSVADKCEVHVHVGCPIPAREHAKIAPPPRCRPGRRDVVGRYGDVGVVE